MKNFIYFFCVFFLIISLTSCTKKEDTKERNSNTKNSFTKKSKTVITQNKLEQYIGVDFFPDIKKIITRGTLNIGICKDDSDIPFIIKDTEGKIIGGLDIEIVSSLAKHLQVKAVFNSNIKSRTELFKKLYTGEIDIAVGELSHTFSRATYIYFSDTYVRLHQSLILSKKKLIELNIRSNPYKYISKNACKIGVHADSSYVEFAQNLFPKAEIYEYTSLLSALDALNNHEILAILDDDNEIMLLARKHPEIVLNTTVFELKNQNDNIAIAISPKNPNLADCINIYLENHNLYFEVNTLIRKYPDAYKCD